MVSCIGCGGMCSLRSGAYRCAFRVADVQCTNLGHAPPHCMVRLNFRGDLLRFCCVAHAAAYENLYRRIEVDGPVSHTWYCECISPYIW